MVKICLPRQEMQVGSLVGKIPWKQAPTNQDSAEVNKRSARDGRLQSRGPSNFQRAAKTEVRGEAVHVCARILLKYEKAKKGKTTLKLSKVIKMKDYTVLPVYTSRQ